MNLARASVRRPVFASMLTLIVVVLGVMSLQRLQIDLGDAGNARETITNLVLDQLRQFHRV